MIFITKKLYTILTLIFIISLGVFVSDLFVIPVYLMLLLIITISLYDLSTIPGKKDINVSRDYEKYFSIGKDNKVDITLHTSSKYQQNTYEIRDLYPESFYCKNDLMFPDAYNNFCVSYNICPVKKGDYSFSATEIKAFGHLGLTGRKITINNKTEIKVFPDIIELKKYLKLLTKNRLEESGYKTMHHGASMEFDFLRDYMHGDNYRDINWKATAKKDYPVTQINKKEIQRNVIALFDCGRMMTTKYHNITKLDHTINASLILAASVIQSKDRFGVISFSDSIDLFFKPDNEKNIYTKILSELYSIEPSFVKSNYILTYEFIKKNITKNTIFFVFSELHNKIVSEDLIQLLKLLRKKHLVKLISFEETEKLTTGYKLNDIAKFSIQLKSSAEKKKMMLDLKSNGIDTVSVNVENIKNKVVNTYFSI